MGGDMDDEEEDEETLQLQLQEIQARLKLKKLQNRNKQSSDTENESRRPGVESQNISRAAAASRAQSRLAGLREEKLEHSKFQNEVHVPVSPIRKAQPKPEQRSPGRVLLGIDKGLRGSDISLKRAPSLRREEAGSRNARTGPFLQRPSSQVSSHSFQSSKALQEAIQEDRPKSFSERMATVRSQETKRQEREARIQKKRSSAFDIDHKQMQNFKEQAVEIPEAPQEAPKFSRDEVLGSYNNPSGNLARSNTVPNLRSAMRNTSNSTAATERPESQASVELSTRKRSTKTKPSEVPESEATQFEPYSSQHLSKRIIPHQVLTRTLSGKKIFLLPELLRIIKGPDFSGPDIEEDVVVFAIVAEKSEPKAYADHSKSQKKGKFMILTLTDLKWSVSLYLFGSAYDKFWKLTIGTIVALLNPGFMGPKQGREATNAWSMVLNSEEDTVLEVGSARDLGFCKSIKKDGSSCTTWIDKRHTEFCDYHVNETLKKTHSKRMEVATMTFGRGPNGGRKFNSQDKTGWQKKKQDSDMSKKTTYDRESHSQIFIGKRSTTNLLDDVDFDPDAFHRGTTKEERMTRRLISHEKERDLKKKLSSMGNGLGADYMKDASQRSSHVLSSSQDAPPPPDAAALGLLSGKASNVVLSPIKRKRTNTISSTAAMGWGSNLTKELGRMKNGENMQGNQPVKKKTRFVTEKGIREAGRESFGGEAAKAVLNDLDHDDDDDDDDLDIVRE
jgi:minichromosome maintenance protein 10